MDEPNLAARMSAAIDHTVLGPDVTRDKLERLCDEASRARFIAVCVNPTWVPEARALLPDSVAVATVIGFPQGANDPTTKEAEARTAVANGADELDMVMNVGRFLSGDTAVVGNEIEAICSIGSPVKVILECALLDDDQKRKAATMCVDAGAAYVKTSTGFGPGGATVHDVALLRAAVGDSAGVKAAGGIRSAATALSMLEAGATRLGTSASMAIIAELGDED